MQWNLEHYYGPHGTGKSYLNGKVTVLLKPKMKDLSMLELTYNFFTGKSFGTEQWLARGDHASEVKVN